MNDIIIPAIIAGGVSIFVSLISFLSVVKKSKDEYRTFQLDVINRYTSVLYEKRLEVYPKVFEITDKIGKVHRYPEVATQEYINSVNQDLRDWKSGIVNLIISEKALNAYYDLLDSFKAKPAKGCTYNGQQMQRMYEKRTAFHNELRRDLDLLHNMERRKDSLTRRALTKKHKVFVTWKDLAESRLHKKK